MKTVKANIRKYGEKVLLNIPTKLFRDSAFPFLQMKEIEEVIIEIKGRSVVIRKEENGS